MDHYAVVGNPIKHSKSPLIHAAFAKQVGHELLYKTIEAPLDRFEQTVERFFQMGLEGESVSGVGKGLNVTVPFKENAWRACQKLSERARLAGAVNTLFLDQSGQLNGDNTDGIGLVTDLKNNGVALTGKKILIIGAGGAVRGVLQPILKEKPEKVVIANRTVRKAEALEKIFSSFGSVEGLAFTDVQESFDVIINGTSASLGGELPAVSPCVFSEGAVVYDMMYGKQDTIFNAWAKQHGVKMVFDGLGMLVEQAAEAFYIWRGVRPQTKEVIELLRDA